MSPGYRIAFGVADPVTGLKPPAALPIGCGLAMC
jgi:hypothetical protein